MTRPNFDIDVHELTEDHPRYILPIPGSSISLKPHQQTLLARCIQYENSNVMLNEFSHIAHALDENDYCKTTFAVLADRVGSGKSYVILALIVVNDITNKDNITIQSHGLNKLLFYQHNKASSVRTNLLVVPHNLATQWEYYIKTFGCNLKHKIVKNQKAFDMLIAEILQHESDTEQSGSDLSDDESEPNTRNIEETLNKISSYDLIVVTSTLYNKFARFLQINNIKLQRVIFDEVDTLNVPGCQSVDANFFWFVTASYGNVLYPLGYNHYESSLRRYVWYAHGIKHNGFVRNILTDMHYHLHHNLKKIIIVKNRESYVESSLRLPEIISDYVQCRTPHAINVLNGVVDRNILEHLNANDIEGALSFISPANKCNNEENIIARVIEKYTRQVSNLNLQLNTAHQYHYDTEAERTGEIQRLQTQLDIFQNKISLITERIKNNDLCTICYDVADNKTITQCCQNTFCFKCISIWVTQKSRCPLCKLTMHMNDIYILDKNSHQCSEEVEKVVQEPSDCKTPKAEFDKYQNLEVILNNLKDDAKVLLFSAYENSFANVIKVLERLEIAFSFLKGNGYHINATLDRYKNGNVKVLLVNTQSYGSGLNLENTTDMILFHKFDTEIEKQVIGRAQRFGRQQPLRVHYLLYENEMSRV